MKKEEEDNEEEMERLMLEFELKNKQSKESQNKEQQSRKKVPESTNLSSVKKEDQEMDVEYRKINKLRYQDLPEDIEMYLIEIYQFGNKLFITGIMENGQTLNIVGNDLYRELYFVLKDENNGSPLSENYLKKAEDEIKHRLRGIGLKDSQFHGEMVNMQYVFEIQEIPKNERQYYKVRFSYKLQLEGEIEPDWEGETYKYVIGTSYTALELLLINKGIKGPCWVKISKEHLSDNNGRNVETGLCADIQFPELINVIEERTEPPTVRVLSFSIKEIVPATINKRKYFPNNKDDSQIYAISYHYCPEYRINIKDQKLNLIHRTYYLKMFGNPPTKEFIECEDEMTILARFEADIRKYDPDFFVCHDSSKILDSLICRLNNIDKNCKIKFSRLKIGKSVSKTNQVQRINTFLAGRLLVDTFFHSKDMVKSIEYDLENMAQYARPGKRFTSISDEEAKTFFNDENPLAVVNKCRDESELTFQIMNHFEILQTTRSLSNICGNLWKRSLENKRAERNEFLIMHECKRRSLIIPDKFRKEKGDDEETEGKKKYQGGLVFEPEKGFYSDYILLLDFNSLYPSLIREYNVCFSKIERPLLNLEFYYKSQAKKKEIKDKKEKERMAMEEENPEEDGLEEMFANVKSCNKKADWGFLPVLIDHIVEQRKQFKKKMNKAIKAKNEVDAMIYDIQQKCYKIVANSIYGCLGFPVSRFYSRPLAALITKKGRDSLMAARDIVSKKGGVRVIYGDTDSLMIEPNNFRVEENATEADKLKSLKKIADELKVEINSKYTFLEIDIDGVFKPLILLMKKKYVANKLTNFDEILCGFSKEPKFSLEFKGIEIVRRDGCKLARDTLEKVINIMVNSDDSEADTRYQRIIDYFVKLNENLNNEPLENFLFSKQLTKKPKDYANADHLPHVKVAMDRINGGEKDESLVNHTIYYLICKPRDDNMALAKNAFDMKSFKRSAQMEPNNKLEIDYDYYKSVVVEPVGRLLLNINPEIYDQIVSLLNISKHRIKHVKDLIGEDDTIGMEKMGETVGNNLKAKLREFSKDLGATIICPSCNCEISTVNLEGELGTVNWACTGCKFGFITVIHNKIRFKIKEEVGKYYNNRKRCTCLKSYELTPVTPCCDLEKKKGTKKSDIAFKLHNFLYLAKDLCEVSISRLEESSDYEKSRLRKLAEMVNQFLLQSKYEDVSDVFAKLKI